MPSTKAIISESDWNLAQEKRKKNAYRREKVHDVNHVHLLSGLLRCPDCGKPLYGNIAKAHSKDNKTRYYYYCKNTRGETGHRCSFRTNLEQTELDRYVAAIISAMIHDRQFEAAIQKKIGTAVSTDNLEKELDTVKGQLRQLLSTKSRLENQMDTLDVSDSHYERKILDLQRRYDDQYDKIAEAELQIEDIRKRIQTIQSEQISGENVYQLLLAFDELYGEMDEPGKKELLRAIIERIDLFPEKREDGCWIRNIVFTFPVPIQGHEVKELPLEKSTLIETVVLLCKKGQAMIIDEKSKYKSWSNLKKQMNDLLCDSFKKSISYFYTNYHEVHNAYGRATINYNKKELVAFSWVEMYEQDQDINRIWQEGEKKSYSEMLREKWMPECTLCDANFIDSVTVFLKTDIATSLQSDNYLLRIFAYVDRRVGKRTLVKIRDEVERLPEWVKQFYQIRCEAENISFQQNRTIDEAVCLLTHHHRPGTDRE